MPYSDMDYCGYSFDSENNSQNQENNDYKSIYDAEMIENTNSLQNLQNEFIIKKKELANIRRALEAAIRENYELFYNKVETTISLDSNGLILEIINQSTHTENYFSNLHTGDHISEIIFKNDLLKFNSAFQEYSDNGKSQKLGVRFVIQGKKYFYGELTQCSEETDDENHFCCLLLHEASQRIEAENILSEESYSSHVLMNAVQAGIILIRASDKTIVEINEAASKIIDAQPEDIIGFRCNKILCPSRNKECPIIDLGKKIDRKECVVRKKDNNLVPVLKTVTDLYLDGQKYLVESFIDISEQKKVEYQLKEVEERLRLAIEASKDGYWDWDLQKNTVYYSSTWKRILGYNDDELKNYIGLAESLTPLSEWKKLISFMDNALRNGNDRAEIEIRMNHKDGSLVDILSRTLIVRNEQGDPVRYIGSHTDITKEKKIIKELEIAKVDAEEANRAKSEFLSSMSHELRTPLNAILGFAQLLEIDSSLEQNNQDYVKEIIDAGTLLLTLINEVLDLARIESGRIEFSIESVNCSDIVEESISLVQTMADKANVTVKSVIPETIYVEADHTRLKQVIVNLLSNAIKYNRPDGTVTVGVDLNNNNVVFSVVDTGLGIPEDKLDDLFVKFNRLGRESGDIQGTGIGLAFSKRLLLLMNGNIYMESKVNEGSSFFVELPLAIKAGKKNYDEEQRGAELLIPVTDHEFKVVYIEDNLSNIKLVEEVLASREYISLYCEKSGIAGLELIKKLTPDLVLLDLGLPDMDGYQVMSILQDSDTEKNIPVVALTARAMEQDKYKANRKGYFVDYLTKPFDLSLLLEVVDSVILNRKNNG